MVDHFIVVEVDQTYLDRLAKIRPVTEEDRADAWAWRIECSDPASCPGWIECDKDHSGMDPEEENSPAHDQYEDVSIHDVLHEWRDSCWVIDHPGCPVQSADADTPHGLDQTKEGRYPVEADWDGTDCTLMLIEPTPDL